MPEDTRVACFERSPDRCEPVEQTLVACGPRTGTVSSGLIWRHPCFTKLAELAEGGALGWRQP